MNSKNYETVEKEPSKEDPGYKNFIKKHELIKKITQEELDKRKWTKKDDDILIKKNEKKVRGILKEDLTLGEYKSFEDLKIGGSAILKEIFKDFLNSDFCCNYINSVEYDPTLINYKNLLITSTLNKVIKPRKDHLINFYHVKKSIAKKLSEESDRYKFLYKLTNSNSPNDIIINYYVPAMGGNYEMLENLDRNKKNQLRQHELWERIFKKYVEDIRANDFDELRYRNLFTFDWGNFLNKYFNSENGEKVRKLFWNKREKLFVD